jgi:hypothetical protein
MQLADSANPLAACHKTKALIGFKSNEGSQNDSGPA